GVATAGVAAQTAASDVPTLRPGIPTAARPAAVASPLFERASGKAAMAGKRSDDGGHSSGDAVCLAITHLLLSPPPALASAAVTSLAGAEHAGWNISGPPKAPHRYSPAAARAPPRAARSAEA
ncbi:MAG: hypothetical protein ABWZ78_10555, partial [Burkholderiaceae bacterium]